MSYSVEYSGAIEADFAALNDDDFNLVNEIFDLLETNKALQDEVALCRHQRIAPRFNAAPLVAWVQAGFEMGYLKIWASDGHLLSVRVVYGVDHRLPRPRLVILGVMPRSEDYLLDSPYGLRLKRDYEDHHLPAIRAA
jgi:hypothetical protein